jgi:hypothetical protein
MNGLRGWGAEPGTKVPGLFYPPGLVLEIDVGQRLPVVVLYNQASIGLFGFPWRREAAPLYRHGTPSSCSFGRAYDV